MAPLHAQLLERDEDLRATGALLSGAKNGGGSALMIEGPAGIGKSALIRAVRSDTRGHQPRQARHADRPGAGGRAVRAAPALRRGGRRGAHAGSGESGTPERARFDRRGGRKQSNVWPDTNAFIYGPIRRDVQAGVAARIPIPLSRKARRAVKRAAKRGEQQVGHMVTDQ